tara:strand:- start:317 stop:1039 length:723 start_codon:yes stop_codon:yes gene_type:complete
MKLIFTILFFLTLLIFQACKNESVPKKIKMSDLKEYRKGEFDTVYISSEPKVWVSKYEYNKIVSERDEFFLESFVSPDSTYRLFLNARKPNDITKFYSNFGIAQYYLWYTYFLKKKYNYIDYNSQRKKLIKLYNSINSTYSYVSGGGSFFAHNIPKINAYAEWDIYKHFVLDSLTNHTKNFDFQKMKQFYIEKNKKELERLPNQNNRIKKMFYSIHQDIENEFELNCVIQFQKRFTHLIE